MRRYYSHYTFIHPDTYLKNHIVEVDDENRISDIFPFEKEIEKTEFYSGLLVFLPGGENEKIVIEAIKSELYNAFPSLSLSNNIFDTYTFKIKI